MVINSLNFSKYFTFSLATVSFLGLNIFIAPNYANAFSVNYSNDFETGDFSDGSGNTVWLTTGDASVTDKNVGVQPGALEGQYGGVEKSYHAGSGSQAVITTACPSDAQTPTNLSNPETECYDTQSINDPRNDDPDAAVGKFNYSGNDQTDANKDNSGTSANAMEINNLQEFLGLEGNALDIPYQNGNTNIGGNRTAKEGSGIKLNDTINSSVPFTISFDWTYLTNDGQIIDPVSNANLGDSDYGFAVIYEENSTTSSREPIVLADSDNVTIPTITNADEAYALVTSGSYSSDVLPAGNYVVGMGVVDIDGLERSSALLVDNFAATSAVPFEFSPSTGLGIVASIIGLNCLRRKKVS